MAGYNVSVYLDEASTWTKFKDACEKSGKRPNTVLRAFIESYCEEVLAYMPIERHLAQGMLEAREIARGKTKGKNARELLEEI